MNQEPRSKNQELRAKRAAFLFYSCILALASCTLLSVAEVSAQGNKKTDSLILIIKNTKSDSAKADALNELAWQYRNSNYDSATVLMKQALSLSEKINHEPSYAKAVRIKGFLYYLVSDYFNALECYSKSQKINEELLKKISKTSPLLIETKREIAKIHNSAGLVYQDQANFPKALEHYIAALKFVEEIADTRGTASILCNIGNIYSTQFNHAKALEYFNKSYKIALAENNKSEIARILSNQGIVYYNQKNYSKALEYYLKSIKISEEIGYRQLNSSTLAGIAGIFVKQNDPEKALKYYAQALDMEQQNGNKNKVASIYGNLASLYLSLKKYDLTEEYLKKALALSSEIGALDITENQEETYYQLEELRQNYKTALEHYKNYISARDSINSEANTKKQVQQEMQYEFDKKETAAKAEQEVKDQKAAADKKQQQIILFSVSGVLLLVIAFAFFVFRNLRVTQKQKLIIEQQKQVVETQKQIVEEKQKEVLDSIRYAKRIQQSLLPTEKYIERNINKQIVGR
jgi:tetratricopeptide (TPR) repeat protein